MAALAGQGRAGLAATWDHIPAGTLSPEPPEEELWGSSIGDPGWGSRDPGSDTGRGTVPCHPDCCLWDRGTVWAPWNHTCMSASSSCFRRRMFSSSWHSSGVRSLGTEQRHNQVSMCGPGNQGHQAPGPASAPSQQLWAWVEAGHRGAGQLQELGWLSPAPHRGQVAPVA